jgi:predicted transcriptional regulator
MATLNTEILDAARVKNLIGVGKGKIPYAMLAVSRANSILEYIAGGNGGVTKEDIANKLAMNTNTVMPYCRWLRDNNFISSYYRSGSRLMVFFAINRTEQLPPSA